MTVNPLSRRNKPRPLPEGIVALEAAGPLRTIVTCHLRWYTRWVWFAGGEVSHAVPVVVVSAPDRRSKKKAVELAKRLRAWGYRTVAKVVRK